MRSPFRPSMAAPGVISKGVRLHGLRPANGWPLPASSARHSHASTHPTLTPIDIDHRLLSNEYFPNRCLALNGQAGLPITVCHRTIMSDTAPMPTTDPAPIRKAAGCFLRYCPRADRRGRRYNIAVPESRSEGHVIADHAVVLE